MKNKFHIILIFLILYSSTALAAKIKVTFINPGVSERVHATGGFWAKVSSFMKAAATDLNIELEVLYAERNHLELRELVKKVAVRKNKPDYLIIVNEMRQGGVQLKTAMDAGIKTFMILNTFIRKKNIQLYGVPREKYKNWIGSLIPDNHYAGYRIAKSIIKKAIKNGGVARNGNLHIVGMAGDLVTPAAIERNMGLKKAVAELKNVDLKQIFVCQWSKDLAHSKISHIFTRYPEVGAIWAANDPIALGSMDGTVALGKKPGKDVYFGGLNWDTPALAKIKEGSLTISMGGHFMTGGWAMVLLHDYHHGKDFKEEGTDLKMKIFDEINSSNVDKYIKKFGDKKWDKIDFSKFSKVLNPKMIKYDFSLKSIFKQGN
ncbi:MAG: substrate-binding domain-containing protein [Deltaproteobacteria bacterium]|nr:substrate-binding domain-containing protein [Deltaproteobacteria bacterium]